MKHLTLIQRYELQAMRSNGDTLSKIASKLSVDKSTVSRELKRNGDHRSGNYSAELAHNKCRQRHSKKKKNIRFTKQIQKSVDKYLHMDYSPEQITGYLRINGKKHVSHERIYLYIWEQKKKGNLLYLHLRRQGKKYAKRGSKVTGRGKIPNRRDISLRPLVVEDKLRFGDLEVDTVVGLQHKSAIVTINDRRTGMLKMKKVNVKEAKVVCDTIIDLLEDWQPYIKTMTADNGSEFAQHKRVSEKTGIEFFFARPYHSWERGANENLNGLIRQYFPKRTDFKSISNQQIKAIENKLNNRPRKRFNFRTPQQEMDNLLFKTNVAFIT